MSTGKYHPNCKPFDIKGPLMANRLAREPHRSIAASPILRSGIPDAAKRFHGPDIGEQNDGRPIGAAITKQSSYIDRRYRRKALVPQVGASLKKSQKAKL